MRNEAEYRPLAVREAIARYLHERSPRQAIVISAAIKAVRPHLTGATLSDRLIADLVAEEAIDRGYALHFDIVSRDRIREAHH